MVAEKRQIYKLTGRTTLAQPARHSREYKKLKKVSKRVEEDDEDESKAGQRQLCTQKAFTDFIGKTQKKSYSMPSKNVYSMSL